MKLFDIDIWKTTKKGFRYKITRKPDNWHFMLGNKNNRWLTEHEIKSLDDEELYSIYRRCDELNMRYKAGFPLSPNWYRFHRKRK